MNRQIESQALEVLDFVQRNVQSRRMIHDLVCADIARWSDVAPDEKVNILERNVRRFRTVCPTLAQKDRVRQAVQALRGAAGMEPIQA